MKWGSRGCGACALSGGRVMVAAPLPRLPWARGQEGGWGGGGGGSCETLFRGPPPPQGVWSSSVRPRGQTVRMGPTWGPKPLKKFFGATASIGGQKSGHSPPFSMKTNCQDLCEQKRPKSRPLTERPLSSPAPPLPSPPPPLWAIRVAPGIPIAPPQALGA